MSSDPLTTTVRDWGPPPIIPKERKIVGEWRPVGREWVIAHTVPTVVNGFGATIETVQVPIYRQRMRRAVWEFVGYEEVVEES